MLFVSLKHAKGRNEQNAILFLLTSSPVKSLVSRNSFRRLEWVDRGWMKTAINWIHASTDLHHVGAHGTAEHSIFVWLGIVISGKKRQIKVRMQLQRRGTRCCFTTSCQSESKRRRAVGCHKQQQRTKNAFNPQPRSVSTRQIRFLFPSWRCVLSATFLLLCRPANLLRQNTHQPAHYSLIWENVVCVQSIYQRASWVGREPPIAFVETILRSLFGFLFCFHPERQQPQPDDVAASLEAFFFLPQLSLAALSLVFLCFLAFAEWNLLEIITRDDRPDQDTGLVSSCNLITTRRTAQSRFPLVGWSEIQWLSETWQ